MALMALRRKGLVDVIPQYGRAKLTRKGREIVEAFPEEFGFARK
jgi:Mn-dependent DtxR family transcriptional regulator